MNQYDYIEAGFKVFGLFGVDKNGACECGNPECKALFKHPTVKNWQHVPHWSDEQLDCMEEIGAFKTGFGVLCEGFLIVDVDPRNGGEVAGLNIDIKKTFTVATGGGGLHVYYKAPQGVALVSHLPAHKGIDFKTSGYVVGCGSLHASGAMYEAQHGSLDDIADAPAHLIELLTRPNVFRAKGADGETVDVSKDDILTMLSFIEPDCDYEEWVRVGMAIHHATGGSGLEIWDEWSRNGKKYGGFNTVEQRWHGFGKSANPAGLGTLIFYAERGGYSQSVEFVSDIFSDDDDDDFIDGQEFLSSLDDLSDIDLRRPVGFVGDVVAWINNQCRYPAENIATATALQAIGNLGGLNYIDGQDGMTTNSIFFCVAASAVGKEAVQQAYIDIMRAGGCSEGIHGAIKSEQEIVRNLMRHPQALYLIDELGIVLNKITNAKGTGASYLEGVIGSVMSIYSKANGHLMLGGDVKDAAKADLKSFIKALKKEIEDEGQTAERTNVLNATIKKLIDIDDGIKHPFLSILGYTTPVTFNNLVTFEQATNGFIARAMIFEELNTNPRIKKGFKAEPMPMMLQATLAAIATPTGSRAKIPTTTEGAALLDEIVDRFWQMAEDEKTRSGLESIYRRGYEMVAKVSTILAIPSGLRTVEHIRWAYALTIKNIDTKIRLAFSNMTATENPSDSIALRITKILEKDRGETAGTICNRLRPTKKADVMKVLEALVESGYVEVREERPRREILKVYYLK